MTVQIKSSGGNGVQDLTALKRYSPARGRDEQPKTESKAATPGATIELSAAARELESIRSMVDRIPEVDEARVAEIRAMIENGTYEPDLEKVADGILQEATWNLQDRT